MTAPGNDEKKKLVVALLVPKAKNGMNQRQIIEEYMETVGHALMPSERETSEYLRSLVATRDIREINGQYFANTENSQHVIKLVEKENDSQRKPDNKRNFHQMNHFNGASRYSNHNNQSYTRNISDRRKSVCYEQAYIEVPIPQPVAPGRISRRRMTMGAQFRPETPPRSRSRSNSPKKNYTFGRSHINNEKRSHSPDSHSRRPRDRSPRSPIAKRSRRSPSPSRERRYNRPRSRSPRRDHHRRARTRSPAIEPPGQENTPVKPTQTVTPQDQSQRTPPIEYCNGVKAVAGPSNNVRSFKFNLIGDGLLHNYIRGLDASIALNPYLLSQELLIATAIVSVNHIIKTKFHKKKCVILSIGTGDLKKGTSLSDMRKQYLTLFRLCHNNGLKPLVATISCMESDELIEKAKVFNEFLKRNFDNVIDLFQTVNGFNGGLANTLASLRKGPKSGKNNATLSIGMHSRLVLRVDV